MQPGHGPGWLREWAGLGQRRGPGCAQESGPAHLSMHRLVGQMGTTSKSQAVKTDVGQLQSTASNWQVSSAMLQGGRDVCMARMDDGTFGK